MVEPTGEQHSKDGAASVLNAPAPLKNGRQSQRFKVSWPSRVLLPGKRILSARTKDVSIGGVGFELDEGISVDTDINIELSPWMNGRQYTIRAKGVVTYNMLLAGGAGFSHGIKFTFVPPEQLADLKSILKSLA